VYKSGNFRKLFAVFVLISIIWTFAGNVYAGEEKKGKFKWFFLEFEFFRFIPGRTTEDGISVNRIPEYFRAVPVHRDDPYFSLSPLPDKAPFINSIRSGSIKPSLKLWFLSTVAIGFILGEIDDLGFGETSNVHDGPPSDLPVGGAFGAASYDYAQHYNNWGPAYVMYELRREEESSNRLKYFVEAKTPDIDFKIEDSTKLCISLFGGYQPDFTKRHVDAINGWHRWGSFERKDYYRLGDIRFNQVYGGLNFGFRFSRNRFEDLEQEDYMGFGIKVFVSKYLQRTNITDAGRDFDLKFGKIPLLFGIGLYLAIY